MKNIYKMIAIGIFLFSLAGCTWLKYNPREIGSHIVRCKTTEAEVVKIYGNPDITGVRSGYMTLTWISGLGIDTFQRELVVFVNGKGVAVDYALDPHGEIAVVDRCSQ